MDISNPIMGQKISQYSQTTGFADNSTVLPQLCLGGWYLGINHCILLTLKNLFSGFCIIYSIRIHTAQDPEGFQTLGHSWGRVPKGTAQTPSAVATPTYEIRNAETNLGISFH